MSDYPLVFLQKECPMSKFWLMTGSARGLGCPIAQTPEDGFCPQTGPNCYGLPAAAAPSPAPEPRR